MHFLLFEASPKPTHPDYGRLDGAFISLYVNAGAGAAAEATARQLIEGRGWDALELKEKREVSQTDYEVGSHQRELFDQALLDGVVAEWHTWPVGAPDTRDSSLP